MFVNWTGLSIESWKSKHITNKNKDHDKLVKSAFKSWTRLSIENQWDKMFGDIKIIPVSTEEEEPYTGHPLEYGIKPYNVDNVNHATEEDYTKPKPLNYAYKISVPLNLKKLI